MPNFNAMPGPDFLPPFGPDPNLPPLPPELEPPTWGLDIRGGVPQPEWPGLEPAVNEDPYLQPDDAYRLDHSRPGTLPMPHMQRMGYEMNEAMRSGEETPLTMDEWNARPWMAYEFLSQRLSPSPTMDALRDWYMAASQAGDPRAGDIFAQQWATFNPAAAEQVRQQVTALWRTMRERQGVQASTQDQLREMREKQSGLSGIESSLSKAKEFVWDDFRDHPLTSVAVVFCGFLIYKGLKGTRAAKWLGIGAAGVVLHTFLKDRFGLDITETFAKTAEAVGGEKAGDVVRNARDSLHRLFFGPEGEGSAVGYLFERLHIHDESEKLVLGALVKENPAAFLRWYSQARASRSLGSPSTPLPSSLQQALNGQNVPSWFREKSTAEKTKTIMNVSEKLITYLGRNAPGIDPVAYLQTRYVENTYFPQEHALWQQTLPEAQPGSPLYAVRHLDGTIGSIAGGFAWQQERSQSNLTFGDIVFAELNPEDWHQVRNYNGAGWSAADVRDGLIKGGKWTIDQAENWIGRPVVNLVTTHIPEFWNNTLKPALDRNGITPENAEKLLKSAIEKAKRVGKDVVEFSEGTLLWRVLRDAGLLVGEGTQQGYTITVDKIELLAVWLEWKRLEGKLMASDYPNWRNQIYDADSEALTAEGVPAGMDVPVDSRLFALKNQKHKSIWEILQNENIIADISFVQFGGKDYVLLGASSVRTLESWVKKLAAMQNPPLVPVEPRIDQPPAPQNPQPGPNPPNPQPQRDGNIPPGP